MQATSGFDAGRFARAKNGFSRATHPRRVRALTLLVTIAAAAGCIAPGAGPAPHDAGAACDAIGDDALVCVGPDALWVGGLAENKTHATEFAWNNSEGRAWIVWDGNATEGELRVFVRDATGDPVFDRAFGVGDAFTPLWSEDGEPGEWRVRLAWAHYSGRLNLTMTAR